MKMILRFTNKIEKSRFVKSKTHRKVWFH